MGLESAKERILLVDDDDLVLRLIDTMLTPLGYRCVQAHNAAEAIQQLERAPFDLLISDIQMPGESGLDFVEHALERYPKMAAMMVSGIDEVALADRALQIGADSYVVKPFTANDLARGVLGALQHQREKIDAEKELFASYEETISRLCIAVEARDYDTATHISGMSESCRLIGRELGLPSEQCDLIRTASTMHDVGKIGIPDHILHKPGPLTSQERAVMEQHTEIGYRMLVGSHSELLQLATTVAWTHHEKLDGTGYPRGLAGDAIPLEGLIAAVADVFDALTRDRVYRSRFSQAKALEMMEDGRGTHFHPDVLDAFLNTVPAPHSTH